MAVDADKILAQGHPQKSARCLGQHLEQVDQARGARRHVEPEAVAVTDWQYRQYRVPAEALCPAVAHRVPLSHHLQVYHLRPEGPGIFQFERFG